MGEEKLVTAGTLSPNGPVAIGSPDEQARADHDDGTEGTGQVTSSEWIVTGTI